MRIKRLAEQRVISVRVVAVDEEDAPVGYGEIYGCELALKGPALR